MDGRKGMKERLAVANRGGKLSNASSRINEIDVLKGIGILLVVLQHCVGYSGESSSLLSQMILAFHMPLFFFASGLVNKRKSINETLARKTASLLAPVVLYSVINAVMQTALHMLSMDKLYTHLKFAGFWFLLSLLYISILDYGVERIVNNRVSFRVLLSIGAFVFGLMFSRVVEGSESTLAIALVGYGFFVLGKLISYYLHQIKDSSRVVVLIVGVIIIVALSFTCRFNSNVYMYNCRYGNPMLFVCNAVLGIAGVTCICFAVRKNRILEFFGRNSLVILVTHFPVYQILSEIGKRLLGSYGTWSIALFAFVFTCAAECVVVFVINKWVPWMTGKIDVTGNK